MKEYKVNRIQQESLKAGYTLSNSFWEEAVLNTDFCYPWVGGLNSKTSFRALHDNENLYFRFDVIGSPILVYVNNNNKMEVGGSDRVEIFFRKNEKLKPYYGVEMDANGRVMDYKANFYRELDFNWKWPKNGLHVKSEINDKGYILTGTISFDSLKQLEVLNNNIIEAGLFRGHCLKLPDDNNDADLKWISWVIPDSEGPDFHIPSSFGKLILE